MKEIKSISINGGEVARIEKTEEETCLLICDDDVCMREVTCREFEEFLKDISYVCITSWDKDLQKDYIEFVEYFRDLTRLLFWGKIKP